MKKDIQGYTPCKRVKTSKNTKMSHFHLDNSTYDNTTCNTRYSNQFLLSTLKTPRDYYGIKKQKKTSKDTYHGRNA